MLTDDAREYFRQAAAKRQRRELVCLECSASFRGLSWARYCGKRCKDRAMQRAARARAKLSPPAESHTSP